MPDRLIGTRANFEAPTRRGFLGGAAALAAGTVLPRFAQAQELPKITSFPDRLKGSGELVVATGGGALAAAERVAFYEPFMELSGIKIIETEGYSTAQVKAQVDTKNVEWDCVGMELSNILGLLGEGDYYEKLDYGIIDTNGIPNRHVHEYSLGYLQQSLLMGYRTDVFQEQPIGWADFWNVSRFPGPRNWISGSIGAIPFLEGALLADGVSKDALYPLDVERAFKSLDKIKPHIVKFWETGAQGAQMLAENEAVMGVIWNGRHAPLKKDGLPVALSWDGAMFQEGNRCVPKGAPNRENAMKLLGFIAMAEPQARFSMSIPYAYTNMDAAQFVPESVKADLPTAHLDEGFFFDAAWWGKNRAVVTERWSEWTLS